MRSFVHGTGENVRRYLHVSDVVNALDTILHYGQTGTFLFTPFEFLMIGETYNIGTDFELSNQELVNKIVSYFPDETETNTSEAGNLKTEVEYVQDRAYNDCRYAVDSSKLHALGWRPVVDFDEGLRETSTLQR